MTLALRPCLRFPFARFTSSRLTAPEVLARCRLPDRRPGLALGCALSLVLACGQAAAQSPTLIRDLNLELPPNESSSPSLWTRAGNVAFFVATTDAHGLGLWKSDGTGEGTVLVRGSTPDFAVASITDLVAVDATVYFMAHQEATGRELWKSDGTEAGTVLVKDIRPGTASWPLRNFRVAGGKLFFTLTDGIHGEELWVSDGTAEGTHLVKDIRPGSASGIEPASSYYATGFQGVLVFRANDGSTDPQAWVSDGTEGGTRRLRDGDPRLARQPGPFVVFGNHVYFAGDQVFPYPAPMGRALWRSDGTSAGTVAVPLPLPQGIAPSLVSCGSWLAMWHGRTTTYYYGVVGEIDLYASDGTGAGTRLLATFPIDPWDNSVEASTAVGGAGQLFFTRTTSALGKELWRADGTTAGTGLVADLEPGVRTSRPQLFTPFGAQLCFFAEVGGQYNLWVTDGTTAGTSRLFTSSYPATLRQPVALPAGLLLFTGAAAETGFEPWRSDGTVAGTALVADLRRPAEGATRGSGPQYPVDVLGTVYFWADDGQHGKELWKTDGSAAGTSLVADLSPGLASTQPQYPGVALGARLVFGASLAGWGAEPCITDGTEVGTVLLRDIAPGGASSSPGPFVAAAGRVFFAASSGLWVTDGSTEGTIQLGTVRPTSSLVPFRGGVVYAAYEAVHGFELWHSDGTVAGTKLLVDIVPGAASSEPQYLAVDGDRLFFAASRPDTGRELFVSDGTDMGTTVVVDRTPGAGSSTISEVRAGAGRVFWVGTDSYGGRVLFASDGTPQSVRGMSGIYRPAELTLVGTTCFFAASSYDNTYNPYQDDRELYVCDGTSARRVRDIYVGGTSGSGPRNLFAVGAEVYFTATDPEHGGELWRSDGTEGGTTLVADLAPGLRSSSPGNFVRSLGSIYFAATDLLKGTELFVLDLPGGFAAPVGTPCGPDQATLAAELSPTDSVTFLGTGPADSVGFLLLGTRAQPPTLLSCGCLLLVDGHPIVRAVRPSPGFAVEIAIPGRKEFQGQIFAAQVVFGGPVDPRISQTSNAVYLSLE